MRTGALLVHMVEDREQGPAKATDKSPTSKQAVKNLNRNHTHFAHLSRDLDQTFKLVSRRARQAFKPFRGTSP